jgi:hypothetical protein
MGVEVMGMAKMKVGITVPVGGALRSLFWAARDKVVIGAWASPQALAKAKRWGWDLEPTHLTFSVGTAPALAIDKEGLASFSPNDVPLGIFTIQGLALELAFHFLADNEGTGKRVTLHLGPSSLGLLDHYLGDASLPEELEVSITAYEGPDGYTRLKVMSNGTVSVKETWGDGHYWDAWLITPNGEVEYVGTVDGPRYRPVWLERALEEVKAKGA